MADTPPPWPIATAPLDASVIAVADEAGNRATAFWRGGTWGCWVHVEPEGEPLIQPLPFEPTRWAYDMEAFAKPPGRLRRLFRFLYGPCDSGEPCSAWNPCQTCRDNLQW